MENYMVTPTNGMYNAPEILVTVAKGTKDDEIIRLAKERSGLSRFDRWVFNARKVY